jgi:hypothetical protein
MSPFTIFLTIFGLAVFEVVSSIDNAVINAEVLSTMQPRARTWFLRWGLLFALVVVRGLLPWIIVWATVPSLGPLGAFTATFSGQAEVVEAIHHSAPLLLASGGVFLLFLFLHWLFLEKKAFGFSGEEPIYRHGNLFYIIATGLLALLVVFAQSIDTRLAVAATIGVVIFFILHGIKLYAERTEAAMVKSSFPDAHKLVYLEIIDTVFSVDGVLGAFAFTFSIPLILLGNGIGAIVVRYLTTKNIETIKRYRYLKNGAMYSVAFLGLIMLLEAYGFAVPQWISPLVTCAVIGYFFNRSVSDIKAG